MAKSLIPSIVKELGVEEGDVFTLVGDDEHEYRFSNGFLEMSPGCIDGDWSCADDATFVELVVGNYDIDEVIKPPFEPKWKERYFTYQNGNWGVTYDHWEDELLDYMRKCSGCIFRTAEEARQARPEVYERITGKKW